MGPRETFETIDSALISIFKFIPKGLCTTPARLLRVRHGSSTLRPQKVPSDHLRTATFSKTTPIAYPACLYRSI